MKPHLPGLVAAAATGLLLNGLGLAPPPAQARPVADPSARAAAEPSFLGPALSAREIASVRARQRALQARPAPAPTLAAAAARARATVTTFTLTTTDDSSLADPAGTTCVDAATGACSLRAAVEASDNLRTPVRIVLGRHAYRLSTGTELLVTNPAGTSFVGVGARRSSIVGDGSRLLNVSPDDTHVGPLVYLDKLTLTGGTSESDGGGIFIGPSLGTGAVVLDHAVVSGNRSVGAGGGIYADLASSLYLSHSTVTDNTSPFGAGLYTSWSEVSLVDVGITDNHSVDGRFSGGAGWYDEFGVGTMVGGSITGNGSTTPLLDSIGGGLLDSYGNLTFTGVTIDHNALGSGGGVYASFDLLEVVGGTISHNRAVDDLRGGGGVAIIGGAQVALHGVRMAGNKVAPASPEGVGGGAIHDVGSGSGNQLVIDRGTRITSSNGSAVYAFAQEGHVDLEMHDVRLAHNTDSASNGFNGSGCGGAICAYGAGAGSLDVTLSATTLADSTSVGNGGSGGLSVWVAQSSGARIHLLHSTFEDNSTGAGGHGGAVGIHTDGSSSPVSIRSSSNTFSGNRSGTPSVAGNGGALAIQGGAAITDHGSRFTGNRSSGPESWGGAVYDNSQQSSQFIGTSFNGNAASPHAVGHGGAVYSDDRQGTTYERVNVARNRSGQYGGGLDIGVDGLDVRVLDSTISGNVAGSGALSGVGGGIHAASTALKVASSTITGNRALQSDNVVDVAIGGGIATSGSILGIGYSTVTENLATSGAGYFTGARSGALLGSIVSANHAPDGSEQDCALSTATATPHSLGGNVLGQQACVAAIRSNDVATWHPRLKKLRDNGGPTRTMALQKGSPAVGLATFQCPATDQRGRGRPASHCDAGAYELTRVKEHHH